MEFRIKIEKIMEGAHLSSKDKNLLIEVLVPYVLSYKALMGLKDDRIKEIIEEIKRSGQEKEFSDLLESKSKHYDDTPLDMINDGISMVH